MADLQVVDPICTGSRLAASCFFPQYLLKCSTSDIVSVCVGKFTNSGHLQCVSCEHINTRKSERCDILPRDANLHYVSAGQNHTSKSETSGILPRNESLHYVSTGQTHTSKSVRSGIYVRDEHLLYMSTRFTLLSLVILSRLPQLHIMDCCV